MSSGNANNPFQARATLQTPLGQKTIYRLDVLGSLPEGAGIDRLPYAMKVLLEACLRNLDGFVVTEEAVRALLRYSARTVGTGGGTEIPFMPGRVVLQDFTGVPCVVDLAAMRAAMVRMGGDPKKVNPLVPCDLVIDHSVQVDAFGSGTALTINSQLEFERNNERYQFLKWGQQALANFRVVPPATGIVHQVNLEYLAKVVWEKDGVLFPDSLVGTDSHTTMINGLGVLGWGVGGIEAEAVMLGQPIYMLLPEVVGVRLTGKLREGVTATDLVLTITEMLRKFGVVNKFVEFFGPGLADMPLANRATIANMAPEYGATCGFFPVDEHTLRYLRLTGRDEKLVQTIEQYCKVQGLWRDDALPIEYSVVLELDQSTVEPSVAGPKRPQDRINLKAVKASWSRELPKFLHGGKRAESAVASAVKMQAEGGEFGTGPVVAATPPHAVTEDQLLKTVQVTLDGRTFPLRHGDVVIAAITSCTNTSNPEVMIAAGLVAKKAAALGLTRKPWVKTSLAPGSKVVTDYLDKAGLTESLDALGFNLVGYGCTTCIGNSGPLPEPIDKAINENELVAASVLSGNRNFEGRVHQSVKANYLASPPLVVAYALAGNVGIDITTEPLGTATKGPKAGQAVYLTDIWPTQAEVAETVAKAVTVAQFTHEYGDVFKGSPEWQHIATSTGELFQWDPASTYIQEPPFFENLAAVEPDAAMLAAAQKAVEQMPDQGIPGSGVLDDPVRTYLNQMAEIPSLTPAEELRLGEMIEAAIARQDSTALEDARRKLAGGTLGLVVAIANKYYGRGVSFLDLVQEGNAALMRAIERFDYRRGYRLSAFSTWYIREALERKTSGRRASARESAPIRPIGGARVLAKLGDSITTDHISPAGNIKKDSPAGKYLLEQHVPVSMFNSYGSRRGNDRVMTRGTFANTRIRNEIAPGTEGGVTMDFTDGKVKPIYDAAVNYRAAGIPLIVLAGRDYGMGSSRDWAAKGAFLLGVKAVMAVSFERIHRSNLVGMGVLPLTFKPGQDAKTLHLDGTETFDIAIEDSVKPRQDIPVTATRKDGTKVTFQTTCRIDTPVEVDYYRNGGILHTVLRRMARA